MDYFNTFNALTAQQLKPRTFKSEGLLLQLTVKSAIIKWLETLPTTLWVGVIQD